MLLILVIVNVRVVDGVSHAIRDNFSIERRARILYTVSLCISCLFCLIHYASLH